MSETNALHERWQFPNPDYYTYIEDLADQITELAGHLNAANYQLLKLLADFDDNEGWRGYNSCAHWLNHRCGTSMGTAREKVRVARALHSLPKISEAFREGRISYSKVRAMTRIATSENEDVLLNTALYGTASHVELQVRLYRRCKRLQALEDENLRHACRELNWYTDDDGSFILRGRFTPEQGAVIRKALEESMDELFEEQKSVPEEVSEETEQSQLSTHATLSSVATRRADAMERVAEVFLAGLQVTSGGGDRFLVNIHTDVETLKADGDGAESELEDTARVSAETSRRLACDSSVVHWSKKGARFIFLQRKTDPDPGKGKSEPGPFLTLNIGRKSRTIPPAIRRALKRRDHGCRFPGCTCSRFVDAHHVKHWADGGETSVYNLVLLCRNHHRLVHEGGYGVHINEKQAVHFTMPDGTTLPQGPDGRSRGNVVSIRAANRKNGVKITPNTAITRWDGDPMDKDMAVSALFWCERRSNSDTLDE